jgi:hypothetical protein
MPRQQTVEPSFDEIESAMADDSSALVQTGDGGAPILAPPQGDPAPPEEETAENPEAPAVTGETQPSDGTQVPDGAQPTEDEPVTGRRSIDKRLSALAAKRREAEAQAREYARIAEEERARSARLERELEAQRSGQPGPQGTPPQARPAAPVTPGTAFEKPKPNYTQPGGQFYQEGEEYDDAVGRWDTAKEAWSDEKHLFQDQQAQVERARAEQTRIFERDIAAALDSTPDWEDARNFVIQNSPEGLQIAISQLPRFSDKQAAWTEMVSYLADNPDELERLNDLFAANAYTAIAELGRISHSLNPASQARPANPAAPAAQPPAAPAPRRAAQPPARVGGHQAPAPFDIEAPDTDINQWMNEVGKVLGAPGSRK